MEEEVMSESGSTSEKDSEELWKQELELMNAEYTPSKSTRKNKSSSMAPPFDLSKIIRTTDSSRPAPTKEDIVVLMRNGKAKLAYVVKTDHKLRSNPMYRDHIVGTVLTVELVPSAIHIKRCVEEAVVADRGFSIGETVVRFKNLSVDPKTAIERRTEQGMIGQIVGCRLVGDVLALPKKALIARNIDLEKTTELELVNFTAAHNYIMLDEWIGDLRDIVNEVTLIYKKHRFTVREGGKQGVYLSRKDRSDENKALIPGEPVQIAVSEAIGKLSKWEKDPPAKLKRLRKFGHNEFLLCVVEKVVPHSLRVRWVTSPTSLNAPSEMISKADIGRVIRLDLSANKRVAASDRVRIRPTNEDQVMTTAEYSKWLDDQFKPMFDVSQSKPCKHRRVGQKKSKSESDSNDGPGEADDDGANGPSPLKNAKIVEVKGETEAKADSPCNSERSGSDRMETIPEAEGENVEEGSGSEMSFDSGSDDDPDELPTPKKKGATGVRHKRGRMKPRMRRVNRQLISTLTNRSAKSLLGEEFIGEVLFPRTVVDVEWMDGTVEKDIEGYKLVPVDPDLDQQDHLPGMLVARKENEIHESEVGLILNCNHVERSTNVRWFEVSNGMPAFKRDEHCTLFDIMPHPSYRRIMIGNLGVAINKDAQDADLKGVVFQVKGNKENGKQIVEFLNGESSELWPTEMTHLFIAEDDDAEDSDEESDSGSPSEYEDEGEEMETTQVLTFTAADEGESESTTKQSAYIMFAMSSLSQDDDALDRESLGRRCRISAILDTPVLGHRDEPKMMRIIYRSEKELQEHVDFMDVLDFLDIFDQVKDADIMGNLESKEWTIPALQKKIADLNDTDGDHSNWIDLLTKLIAYSRRPAWLKRAALWAIARPDKDCEQLDRLIEHVERARNLPRPPPPTVPSEDEQEESKSDNVLEGFDFPPMEHPVDLSTSAQLQDVLRSLGQKVLKLNAPATSDIGSEVSNVIKAINVPQNTCEIRSISASINSHSAVKNVVRSEEAAKENEKLGTFEMVEKCTSHTWLADTANNGGRSWMRSVLKEHKLLREHLPEGMHVVTYEDRLDLLSMLIVGPKGTPFDSTPFAFDVRLPALYPVKPPEVHYIAYSQEQLNPNLYQNGKVCTSLLGTWQGQGVETWGPSSNLQQVFLSIQGLILVPEPFFNEAGYEAKKDLPEMVANSKRYNETAAINSLEYMWKIYARPPDVMRQVIRTQIREAFPDLRSRIQSWLSDVDTPHYPANMSKGFRMALEKQIAKIEEAISAKDE